MTYFGEQTKLGGQYVDYMSMDTLAGPEIWLLPSATEVLASRSLLIPVSFCTVASFFIALALQNTCRGVSVTKALCFLDQGREFDPGRGGCFLIKVKYKNTRVQISADVKDPQVV